MKLLLTAMVICLCGCSTIFTPRAGSRAHLDSIIIPSFVLDDVPIRDAVDELHRASAFHDPRRLQGKPYGFSFCIKFEIPTGPVEHPSCELQDPFDPFTKLPPSALYSFPNVSLHGANRSLADLLNELCNQAGAEYSINKGTIVIQQRKSGQQSVPQL
jgi:hypothetical protein